MNGTSGFQADRVNTNSQRTKRRAVLRSVGEASERDETAAGDIIIRTIMETLGMPAVLISDLGLREGVLIDLARRRHDLGLASNPRIRPST